MYIFRGDKFVFVKFFGGDLALVERLLHLAIVIG
jgi:hypothetical protein